MTSNFSPQNVTFTVPDLCYCFERILWHNNSQAISDFHRSFQFIVPFLMYLSENCSFPFFISRHQHITLGFIRAINEKAFFFLLLFNS